MILKSHLCGQAVTFERWERPEGYKREEKTLPSFLSPIAPDPWGRPQGSLYSQQKRKIADACEYMRRHHRHKPLIFCLTSPGETSQADEKQLIRQFTHNLRNGLKCKHYVWVREYTVKGYPHFHFVADVKKFDVVKLSLWWSSLFGATAKNSIRLGTKRGQMFLTTSSMAYYMSKYIGKSLGEEEKKNSARIQRFRVSQSLAKLSAPKEYVGKMERSNVKKMAYRLS